MANQLFRETANHHACATPPVRQVQHTCTFTVPRRHQQQNPPRLVGGTEKLSQGHNGTQGNTVDA